MEMILKFGNRDLEKRDGLYKAFYAPGEKQTVSINGVTQEFVVLSAERTPFDLDCWLGEQHYYGFVQTVTLMSVEKAKSKQEVEAEAAVEKAKSSLEAAKKVLESLKGI